MGIDFVPRSRHQSSVPRNDSMPDAAAVTEFKYPEATRKNLPLAGSPPGDRVAEEAKVKFAYDPHRPPVLRFNEQIQRHKELLEKAARQSLTRDEIGELTQMLEAPQPWLEWAG